MKKKPGGVSPEEIEKARSVDLLSYLQACDPAELVYVSGSTYCTRSHDSLKISNGAWMWFSQGIGGWSALDYLIKVKNYGFIEAVRAINGQEVRCDAPVFSCPKKEERKLLLPQKNSDERKITAYLLGRCIDREIIDYCVKKGYIYESLPYHNVIFMGYDSENIPRYASYRSTGKRRSLGDAAGSDKRFSFRIENPESKDLHVFESAIDLLSYATLVKKAGGEWKKENLMSLAGVYSGKADRTVKVPAALARTLSENPKISRIFLHLDNDIAGRRAAKGLAESLCGRAEVYDEPPASGKDMNDHLCMICEKEQAMKKERTDRYER